MTDKPNHPAPDLAALRDDLTHALGSDHLADLALRAVEPALLAVEVDTAQRMQDDVDRERRRADEQQQRAQRAEADAADWRTVAKQAINQRDAAREEITKASAAGGDLVLLPRLRAALGMRDGTDDPDAWRP